MNRKQDEEGSSHERVAEAQLRDLLRDRVRVRPQGSEFDQLPLVEVKAAKESYKDALEAARDRTFTKQMAEKVRLMAQGFPEADADVLAMRGEDPPERIGVVDRGQNKVLEPLHDERGRGRRLLEGDALNLRDATRMMGDFRDAQARYQAELLAQLQQTEPEQSRARACSAGATSPRARNGCTAGGVGSTAAGISPASRGRRCAACKRGDVRRGEGDPRECTAMDRSS